ncbi:MAG: hypothetical protein LBR21_07450 [Propionibacteriaceae bacterium]|jgi:hypothetical protein|nr:hypothetical protein [Propionibacteriaceae bacterium]
MKHDITSLIVGLLASFMALGVAFTLVVRPSFGVFEFFAPFVLIAIAIVALVLALRGGESKR